MPLFEEKERLEYHPACDVQSIFSLIIANELVVARK